MKKCLWVLPKNIFPVCDGARKANHSLLKSIRGDFEDMDVLIFNDEILSKSDEMLYRKEFYPGKIFSLKKNFYSSLFFKLIYLLINFIKTPFDPVTTSYFRSSSLKNQVKVILQNKQYDIIIFDGLHPFSAFIGLLEFENIPVIYRAHNVEQDLWKAAAGKTKNFFIRQAFLFQGKLMARFEMSLISRSKKIWAISPEDRIRFAFLGDKIISKNKIECIPVGFDFKKIQFKKSEGIHQQKIKLLFLGKLDWPPNKDGLKWFLQEVWPSISPFSIELDIVGSGDARWGKELFSMPGINFLGFVKDLDQVYSNCDFSIIPIQYGSGTRIKVLESISKGVPIVSTSMGVQGSGLEKEHYFHAEDANDWKKLLANLDPVKGRKVADMTFLKFKNLYSPDSVAAFAYKTLL